MKNRFKSKTYWLSLAGILLGTAVANPDIVGPYLGEHSGLIMMGLGVSGMIIRELTTSALDEK